MEPQTANLSIRETALQYISSGLSVLPVDPKNKRPISRILPTDCNGGRGWGQFQRQIAHDSVVKTWFASDGLGVGVICGKVSRNLEVIDFDAPELFIPWCEVVDGLFPGLRNSLPQVQTPSGGYHVYYRCSVIRGNQKLAERQTNTRRETTIETRGEGGYVQAPPSPNYRLLSGDILDIPVIDEAEREILLNAARTFNEYVDVVKEEIVPSPEINGTRPGDQYNSTGDWRGVIRESGWDMLFSANGKEFWRRPGKKEKTWSATWNHGDCAKLYVFSSNASPFEPMTSYSPFSIYTMLKHNGNYQAASRDLFQRGYGTRTEQAQTAPVITIYDSDADPEDNMAGWRTLKDAYIEKPPREYAVGGIIPLPSLCILYGSPGSLKTFLLMDMVMCVISGKRWLAGLQTLNEKVESFETLQAAALWVDVDNGFDRLERRWSALGRAHGVDENCPLHYTSFPTPPFFANDDESVNWLIGAILAAGAKIVVIDNLGTISGGCDENSADMIGVMSGLRTVAETTGCAIVVVHHRNKNQDQKRRGNALRGHSSIEGAVDLALLVDREDGDDSVTLWSTKSRDAEVLPFCAIWTFDADDTGQLLRGQFYGMGKPEKAESTAEQAKDFIRSEFISGTSQSGIVSMMRNNHQIGRNATISALNALVRERVLRTETGPKNSLLYFERNMVHLN